MYDTAEIIAVGTELLLGSIANTDGQMLSQVLNEAGVSVLYHTVVGDNPARLSQAVQTACRRVDLVVITGGLGPTYDDITCRVVSEALGLPLEYRPQAEADMRQYFDTMLHREMPLCNLQQAWLPQGAEIFRNRVGTAPGCVIETQEATVALLPGVPHECRTMAREQLLPWLVGRTGQVIVSRQFRIFGLTEAQVQELLGPIMDHAVNPSLAPYAQTGQVLVRMTARGPSEEACRQLMEPLLPQVRQRLGDCLYSEDGASLAGTVVHLLAKAGLTLATAESCTGGLIAKELTDIPGASAVFRGGVVSYTNDMKAQVLGVPQQLLEEYGAVSAPVAKAMAEGARRITGAQLAISVTGVAGPDRDDRDNPVGTVFLGLAGPDGVRVRQLALGSGERNYIRILAALHALDMVRREITHTQGQKE